MKKGDRVTYVPTVGTPEHGIVKRMDGDHAFVVYSCAGEWGQYENYTAARTRLEDLREGWI